MVELPFFSVPELHFFIYKRNTKCVHYITNLASKFAISHPTVNLENLYEVSWGTIKGDLFFVIIDEAFRGEALFSSGKNRLTK